MREKKYQACDQGENEVINIENSKKHQTGKNWPFPLA